MTCNPQEQCAWKVNTQLSGMLWGLPYKTDALRRCRDHPSAPQSRTEDDLLSHSQAVLPISRCFYTKLSEEASEDIRFLLSQGRSLRAVWKQAWTHSYQGWKAVILDKTASRGPIQPQPFCDEWLTGGGPLHFSSCYELVTGRIGAHDKGRPGTLHGTHQERGFLLKKKRVMNDTIRATAW